MATQLSRWFGSGWFRRRTDGAGSAVPSSVRAGRRASFERCEPRALLSATTALDSYRLSLQVPGELSGLTWQIADRTALADQLQVSDLAAERTTSVTSFLDATANEGGLITANQFLIHSTATDSLTIIKSFDDFGSSANSRYAYLLGSPRGIVTADDSVASNSWMTLTNSVGGGVDFDVIDSDRGTLSSLFGSSAADADVLVPGPVTSGVLAAGGPASNADAIYLAMRPAMQSIKPAELREIDSEGGAVATPVRRASAEAFAMGDSPAASSTELAAAWKARRSLAAFDDDAGSDKLRARAVALEVGGDVVASTGDLRAAALARDAAFNAIEASRSARAAADGGDSTEAGKIERETARRAEHNAAKDAAGQSLEKVPADDSASHVPASRDGRHQANQGSPTTAAQSHDVSQAPVAGLGDDDASATQRSAGLQADESRPRMAAGLAAFLVGGTVLIRRRRSTEMVDATQHPPRRRGR